MKKTKRILIEEDEPSQEAITKAAKKVKGMKSGKPVKMKKGFTEPKRNYAQEALKTGAKNAAIKNAASRAKPDRVKPSTERVYTSTEITKAKRDATKKRVGRGESSRRISNKEATILIRAREMTEYQRIGAVLAEAMGHRVDELAFLPALATAGKVVGPMIASKLVDKGVESAADKLKKKKELAAQAASDKELAAQAASDKKLVGEGKTMNKFVKKLMEVRKPDLRGIELPKDDSITVGQEIINSKGSPFVPAGYEGAGKEYRKYLADKKRKARKNRGR